MSLRVALTPLLLVIQTSAGPDQEPTKPIPPWERRDILGRPIPWGKEVADQRVCLWMPATRLLYGQPIDVHLETAQVTPNPPHLRLHWDGPRRTVFFEWTDDRGKPVTFQRRSAGSGSWLEGNGENLRLEPTETFARGRYLVPGKYRMRVVIDAKRWPADPLGWVGRVESNELEFVVIENDDRGRAQLVPETIRDKAAELVRALDAERFERRDNAEKGLIQLGFDALPLLEKSLEAASAEARSRSRRVLRTVARPLLEARDPFFRVNQAVALLSTFGNEAWQAIGDDLPPVRLGLWRVDAARVAPVPSISEGDPLPSELVARLVKDLNSPEPHVRVAAMRSLPRTENKEVLTALVERLADTYKVLTGRMIGDPVEERLVAYEAPSAIAWQGKAIIEPLLTFARQEKNRAFRRQVLELLGSIGPDPRTLAFVRESVATGIKEDRLGAIPALGMLGPGTLPDLIKLAEAGDWLAIQELSRHGDAKTLGPWLVNMLRHKYPQFAREVISMVEKFDLRELLPDLKRLAQDDNTEQNVQAQALGAFARMANRKDAEELLLERLGSKKTSARGNAVFLLAAIECRQAVPRILELLSDPEWYVRAQADTALRGLSQRPEGVGYDAARNRDPDLWRNWWKGNQ